MFKAPYNFVFALVPLVCGISIFHTLLNAEYLKPFMLIFSFLIPILVLINCFYKESIKYCDKGIIGILLFLSFFILGGILNIWNKENNESNHFSKFKFSYSKIIIANEPEFKKGVIRVIAKVESGLQENHHFKLCGHLLLAIKVEGKYIENLKYGDELIASLKPEEIDSPKNPGEFDFKSWLALHNIYHQAFIKPSNFIKVNHFSGSKIQRLAYDFRAKLIRKYRAYFKNDEVFAVASTLILGYRSNLTKETLSAYSKTGTIHALSVSGAHVGIIYAVLNSLFFFLNRRSTLKVLKFIIICSLIWSYAFITGFSPSVLRSAIMISIFILSKILSRNTNPYNVLAFSAFCQLIYDPFLLYDVGFQLSYLAVFGLISLQDRIYKLFYFRYKYIDVLWKYTALSLSAQLITFPLSIYYFHQFPVYFLFGNLFIAIPLSLIMYLGIVVLIPGFSFLSNILEYSIQFTNTGLKWISELPFSTVSSIWIDRLQLMVLCICLFFFIYAWIDLNKKCILIGFVMLTIYVLSDVVKTIHAHKQLMVVFFSLRKNYAAAFIDGKQAVLVTDLQKTDPEYLFSVQPALDKMRVKYTDQITFGEDLTHSNFIKKNHQIVFYRYSILLVDESFNYKSSLNKANFSALWLHNSKISPDHALPNMQYKCFLVDASNRNYMVNQWTKISKNLNIGCYFFKKNKAYLINPVDMTIPKLQY